MRDSENTNHDDIVAERVYPSLLSRLEVLSNMKIKVPIIDPEREYPGISRCLEKLTRKGQKKV